jgi:hypothetical protein
MQETLLGGDIYGNIYTMNFGGDDNEKDIEASFLTASWNPYMQEGLEVQLNYLDILVDSDNKSTATINFYKDTDSQSYISREINFLPNLHIITYINDIINDDPIKIIAPSHGLSTNDIVYIYGVEGIEEINSGEIGTGYIVTVIDDDTLTFDSINGVPLKEYTGGGALYGKRFYKEKVWKRVFAGGIGYQHKIEFISSGSDAPVKIHALRPWFKQVGRRQVN